MKVVKIECPNCGASLEMNIDKLMMYCPYCRTELPLDVDVEQVVSEREETKRHEMDMKAKKEEQRHDRLIFLGLGIFIFVTLFGVIIVASILGL